MASKHKILFLYTELAEYFLSCCRQLVLQNTEVHIVRKPVNKEAPFNFDNYEDIYFYERKDLSFAHLVDIVERITPGAIICSGWTDRQYVSLCKKYSGRIKTVMTLDNKWTGSPRQRAASVIGKFTLSKFFTYAWVPGEQQAGYARRLGFREKNILRGFYSCNQPHFKSICRNRYTAGKKFAHRFIFVGRYYEFKGVRELWQGFIELKQEMNSDWELWCMGTGDVEPIAHPAIRHFGFVQPAEMEKFIAEGGVFILPSRFEPWGVALHEFAAAGFPLLCSNEVGAAEAFLEDGKNGFIFNANDKEDIKRVMKKMILLNDTELLKMGSRSTELSDSITPASWSKTLLSILEN